MPAMLMYPGNRGWPAFQALLRGLLRFLEPYLRNAQLTEAIRLLYKVGAPHIAQLAVNFR
jgi:CCR4-NOT transcription complex subunit 1